MGRIRDHNGVSYRWTRKGWKPTVRHGKPAHWSDAYGPGLKSGTEPNNSPDAPKESPDETEGKGGE